MTEQEINRLIQAEHNFDTNLISDGYHSFGELYEHRCTLWVALCNAYDAACATAHDYAVCKHPVWRTQKHSDGSSWDGWFLLGMGTTPGEQMTYHLPMKYWDRCHFADDREKAPEWDGHTSEQVLQRIANL